MPVAVSHENESVTSHHVFLTNLLAWLVARPEKYEIIDQDSVGSAGGWFVFSMIGYDWQLWIGSLDGNVWHADNKSAAFSTSSLCVAFSPGGGWNAADTPVTSGAMFSDAPVSGHWAKIRRAWSTVSATSWFTVIDDDDTGMFIVLTDNSRNNSWDYGFALMPIESRMTAEDDPYPWVLLAGIPVAGGSDLNWIHTSGTAYYSVMLLPGGSAEGSVQGADGLPTFTVNNQPNPVTGAYDTERVEIRSASTGCHLLRGKILDSCMRYVISSLPERLTVAGDTWIVPASSAQFILPWVP